MTRALLRLLCAALVLVCAQAARAQSCTVSSTGMAFGVYTPGAPSPNDSASTVTVTCTAVVAINVNYTLSLSAGGSGSIGGRQMLLSGGTATMNYQVYTDSGRSKVFGDGTGGSFTIGDGYPLQVLVPVIKTYPVWGRVPAGQNIKAGSYGDSTIITVTW